MKLMIPEGPSIETPTDASLLGVNGFRIDGRRHFGDLSKSLEDNDTHESRIDLSRLMVDCQIHDRQSPITRTECGVGPYVMVLESGLGMIVWDEIMLLSDQSDSIR